MDRAWSPRHSTLMQWPSIAPCKRSSRLALALIQLLRLGFSSFPLLLLLLLPLDRRLPSILVESALQLTQLEAEAVDSSWEGDLGERVDFGVEAEGRIRVSCFLLLDKVGEGGSGGI